MAYRPTAGTYRNPARADRWSARARERADVYMAYRPTAGTHKNAA